MNGMEEGNPEGLELLRKSLKKVQVIEIFFGFLNFEKYYKTSFYDTKYPFCISYTHKVNQFSFFLVKLVLKGVFKIFYLEIRIRFCALHEV